MIILGIESSCDETAASVVVDGRRVLSNVIASQVPIHQRYGGVVPEIASRAHLEQIVTVVERALGEAGSPCIDAVAVTRGPGLIGCLLVGVEFAKTISLTRGVPLLAVHHVAGHVYSPHIGRERDAWGIDVNAPGNFAPYVALAISGGHSSMVVACGPLEFEPLGETLDDAVGEAYDKIAKLIGLGYPGGPLVDKLAAQGNAEALDLPRPMIHRQGYDFSFSGLKTAFAREVEKVGVEKLAGDRQLTADFCASFQAACIDVLLARAQKALRDQGLRRLAVVGGVASNRGLRAALASRLRGIEVAIPEPEFCTDNAAMIAGAAHHLVGKPASIRMSATAQLELCSPAASWKGSD